MTQEYIENPKTAGSGIVCCIPQKGTCPNNCADCFFQSGRSYLEPLDENLPNIPPDTCKRVVRMNDGNDSNHQRDVVVKSAGAFEHAFYNTATPDDIGSFDRPVVLTVNPAAMTDTAVHLIESLPNLMFVRFRTNTWNVDWCDTVVRHYTERGTPVVLTFMAYYQCDLPEEHAENYEYRQRTMNSYWCITERAQRELEARFADNPLVYSCGYKGTYACKRCGNCLREYYGTLERMRESK